MMTALALNAQGTKETRPIKAPLLSSLSPLSLFPCLQADESKPKKPNIILIVVDKMRLTAMGMAGSEKAYTSNLDLLVQDNTNL